MLSAVVERLLRRQKHTVRGVVLQGIELLLERVGVLAPRVLSSAGEGLADAPLLERLAVLLLVEVGDGLLHHGDDGPPVHLQGGLRWCNASSCAGVPRLRELLVVLLLLFAQAACARHLA